MYMKSLQQWGKKCSQLVISNLTYIASIYKFNRHSDASVRPMFSAIFKMLSHSDSQLLSWSDKDKRVHPEACCIGAPLEAGDELYPDLQDYYLDEPSKRL